MMMRSISGREAHHNNSRHRTHLRLPHNERAWVLLGVPQLEAEDAILGQRRVGRNQARWIGFCVALDQLVHEYVPTGEWRAVSGCCGRIMTLSKARYLPPIFFCWSISVSTNTPGRHLPELPVLVVDERVAVGERSALHVLAGDADVPSLKDQGTERERFGSAPVDALFFFERLRFGCWEGDT